MIAAAARKPLGYRLHNIDAALTRVKTYETINANAKAAQSSNEANAKVSSDFSAREYFDGVKRFATQFDPSEYAQIDEKQIKINYELERLLSKAVSGYGGIYALRADPLGIQSDNFLTDENAPRNDLRAKKIYKK
ncbi:MAG: hypothetical protein LBF86_05110 [Helicobacteraceae bacterium]|nr:hypothetical protein [Helicobacteraceae bacterium]